MRTTLKGRANREAMLRQVELPVQKEIDREERRVERELEDLQMISEMVETYISECETKKERMSM